MNNTVSSFLFGFLSKIRNPNLNEIYHDLKSNENLSREELYEKQFKKLKAFLIFVEKNSDYYKDLFKSVGFQPEKMKSLDELKIIPTVCKRTLIDENDRIHTNHSFKKVRTAVTSGTSGEALTFRRNEEWDSANRAGVMRGYSWHGVKVSDKNGYFWGYNLDTSASRKIGFLDFIQNRKRIFKYTDEEIKRFCSTMKDAVYLSGYSSMIYKVAQEVNKKNIKFDKIKMIKGTSEMILPKYQVEVEKAFGIKMISEYGATETGLISFECRHGSQHVNTDAVVVETDEDNEIIVTNLYSHSFPIIRYRLGDIVKLSDKVCSCGMRHPLIDEIIGRKGANVKGRNNEYPSFTFYYVFKNLAMEDGVKVNYKARQDIVGKVIIEIEGIYQEKIDNALRKHLKNYFSDDVDFDVQYSEVFEQQKKKRQSFISSLDS